MNPHHSLIAELEEIVRGSEREKRASALGRVTDFFLTGVEFFTDDQVELFDSVLMRLIDDIEATVLADLANSLAPCDRAPRKVVGRLARHGAIVVAGPLLARSHRLELADLVEIAETTSQEHLLAISVRKRLEAAVTGVLVQRGNTNVLLSVARNAGASFSATGFAALVRRCEGNDILTESVGRRSDIPAALLERLLVRATRIVRESLLVAVRADGHPDISRVLAKVSRELGVEAKLRQYDAAERSIAARKQAGTLNAAALREFAKSGQAEEMVVGLAVMCRVAVDVVDRLMDFERVEALLVPCRAADLDWATVREIIGVHARGRPLAEDALRRTRENYAKLTLTTAERILQFWESRRVRSHRLAGAGEASGPEVLAGMTMTHLASMQAPASRPTLRA